jgi:CubicO group peptidase (beta-lactamase class C family)
MLKTFTIYIFLLVFFCNSSFAQISKLDSLLNNVFTQNTLVGFSVAVIKGDSLVYNKGFGLRDVGRNLPIDNNTSFRIASISKTITALTLMTLYDKGLFGLDEDISKYIGFNLRNPNYPNDTITIRKLLSHTSSLLDGDGYDYFLSATAGTNIPTLQSLLTPSGAYYTSGMFQNRSPKSNYFQYANINFGVIGTLIEKLSGKRFDIVVRENVLTPLGIDGSFNIQDLSDINNLAALYRRSGNTWLAQVDNYNGIKPPPLDLSNYIIGTNGIIFSPTGGLRISARDLAKIMIVLKNNGKFGNTQVISENAANEMLKTVWTYNGGNGNNYYGIFNRYALGNHTTTDLLPGQVLIGHPGEAYGLISDMYFSKNKNYGIVFICNGGIYSYGSYSGWYKQEEQVYNAVLNSISGIITNVETDNPNYNFTLEQNYPNPFNPETIIKFTINNPGFVKLSVYNVLGEEIALLVNEYKNTGSYSYTFNSKTLNLSGGVYFYKLTLGNLSTTKKMILLQ